MKSWRLISLLGFLSLLGGGAGCALETGEEGGEAPVEESMGVDSEMLDTALLGQATLEEAGFRLIGRVWFARDGYSELYERQDGPPLAFFAARSGTKEAVDTELMPLVGEPLDSYVARAARGRTPRYLGSGGESGPNVLLFDAQKLSPSGTGIGQSREALANEFCPKADYDSLCTLRFGYEGSTSTKSWNVVDTKAESNSGHGSSYMTVTCSDRRAARVNVVDPTGKFTNLSVPIPQGVWHLAMQGVSWHSTGPENCDWLHWCCDYRDIPNRATVTVFAEAAAQSGSNLHSCGRVMNRADRVTEGCGIGGDAEPFRTALKLGFLDANGRLSVTERHKFCSATCSRSCVAGPGLPNCMAACGNSCMAN